MKNCLLACCAFAMFTFVGFGNVETADAQIRIGRRAPRVYRNRIDRSFNRGFRRGYRVGSPYLAPRGRFVNPRFGRFNRGYRGGFVSTPFFSIGF